MHTRSLSKVGLRTTTWTRTRVAKPWPCIVEQLRARPFQHARAFARDSLPYRSASTTARPGLHQVDSPSVYLVTDSTAKSNDDGLWRLPTSILIRNIVLGFIFTSPKMVSIGTRFLEKVARSRSGLLSIERNPVFRVLLRGLFYNQFCSGATKQEIAATRQSMLSTGYTGIILAYAKEYEVTDEASALDSDGQAELIHWRDGNLKTLDMISSNEFLAIKFTGAGSSVMKAMRNNTDMPEAFRQAMDDICQKAKTKGCRLWVDAEYQEIQPCIDKWVIDFMRQYNREQALVYNTIQAYLKSSQATVQHHLELASQEGWHLGIKLVRGAYIGHDPRALIHDTKQDTDDSYNGIARDLLSSSASAFGLPKGQFPKLRLFLAGHNPESISMAWGTIRQLQQAGSLENVPDFGQLQGMGDHIGCQLLQRAEQLSESQNMPGTESPVPKIYKYTVWGTVQECMMYLVRRAHENSSGTDRLKDGISAYRKELRRRLLSGRQAN